MPIAKTGWRTLYNTCLGCAAARCRVVTMFWQQSQYDSRLGFSFRVLVRVRVRSGLGLMIGLWVGL